MRAYRDLLPRSPPTPRAANSLKGPMWIADFLNGNPAGDAASLPVDAQQFAYDHMAKKFARHLRRE